jgi:2,3-bisphosphoglycerate-dependent phosphoglycerate mutase
MTGTAVLEDRKPADGAGQATATGPVLWLVRHGESTWNALGLAQGHRDEALLTRRGMRQAWTVAGHLCDQPIRTLYASDLRRAMQTAAPLASVLGLPVIRDARLRERCLGTREGGPSAAISAADTGLREGRVADPDARPPGGESLREFYRRVAAFASDITPAPLPGDAVVIAHGGTLRMLRACLASVPVERMRWDPVANGCIVRLVVPAGSAHESTRR